MEQNPKQQVVERIKAANNILVTVSNNPTVDQLAACIGFTLMLNKLGKHATAVFSGAVPSTLEFLQPEKTLEKNTDSLQDFIIALDKSKADKLRYKVEDEVVRIFITPYRTSLSEKDLDFSLGDFNVDVVVALGVVKKEEIDQAIVAHGRILHDAVVMTVTDGETVSNVGSINWHEPTASSLSEMLVSISESFQSGLLDPQMATSFLTGIVSETERFSNDKTSPKVMTMSAQLMAAGANQQLIATKLAPPPPEPEPAAEPYEPAAAEAAPTPPEQPKPDGELDIVHEPEEVAPAPAADHAPIGAGVGTGEHEPEPEDEDEIHIDDDGNLKRQAELAEQAKREADAKAADDARAAEEAAEHGIPAPGAGEDFLSTTRKVIEPIPGQHTDPLLPTPTEPAQPTEPALNLPPVAPDAAVPEAPADTLAQLEQEVDSPHLTMVDNPPAVDDARQAVASASLDTAPRPEAAQSLGAQHMNIDESVAPAAPDLPPVMPAPPTMTGVADILQANSTSIDPAGMSPAQPAPAQATPAFPVNDPLAPPPVPPPMTAPYFEPKTSHHNPYLNPTDKPVSDEPNESV